jgi:hypothetical protein
LQPLALRASTSLPLQQATIGASKLAIFALRRAPAVGASKKK